jgi:hypothetical protein
MTSSGRVSAKMENADCVKMAAALAAKKADVAIAVELEFVRTIGYSSDNAHFATGAAPAFSAMGSGNANTAMAPRNVKIAPRA